MTARVGTMSVDGTPISQTDLARIEAEEVLHAEHQKRAARVVAAGSLGADDCRMLLAMLGLENSAVAAARGPIGETGVKPARKHTAAA